MLQNYLTIAARNLRKSGFFSFINVAGLSAGIAICLIIVLYISDELSYDRHHENGDRIVRIKGEIKFGGNHWNMVYCPAPMAETLANDFPEVEATCHFRERGSYLIKRESENIKEHRVIWASPDVFKIFSIPFLEGDPLTALREPNTMAISKTAAEKFFPNEPALGKTLMLDNKWNLKITGVYKDMPGNSHFHFDYMLSMTGLGEAKSTNWLSNNFQTYVLLREGADAGNFEKNLDRLLTNYIGPQAAVVLGGDFSLEKFEEAGNLMKYEIQPLHDIHLHSNLLGEFEPTGDITYVYLFGAIALFILLIACINFMNLSTARSANRAKEVGMRKVLGSFRSHLIRQFLTESVLLSAFSFLLAVGLSQLLLPVFNDLAGKELSLPFLSPAFYLLLLCGAFVTGILAGIYPAFFLSAFRPLQILKGNLALGMKSGTIRSSLVVIQFVISIVLVIGTITVFRQLDYIQHKKLGFEKDQVIIIDDVFALGDHLQSYKNEMLNNSAIQSGTVSGFLPVHETWRSDNTWWPEGKAPTTENMVNLQTWGVDHDYIKTLGMSIIRGRDFSADFPADSSAVILNETAVAYFGLEGDPVGKRIVTFSEDNTQEDFSTEKVETYTVIGVVENFHFESLRSNIGALMFFLERQPRGLMSFRYTSQDTREVIAQAEKLWKEMAPGQPFNYSFLDENFGKMYANETRLGKLFGVFASLAIFIACLGLFALTAFTAEQRTKEIGIRKVLGASVGSIVLLLSTEFGRLVVIAFALATPVAWWAVKKWLEGYEYKVEIGWPIYAVAGITAFIIAWLTMSYQSIRAARSNPVKSLRSE